ncbi:putative zinc finger motif, C2HC5-type-domain-containing protein [Massariosphaeria phaeospora]|uniref:Putative zinc finger motif, C2HC5-type-domain-containing protein n=1 Tax=Massariosphaeria phaeospora TaxID=100035 RepID=A0A7C8MGV8_9PLEO|nr:putative zinc finger motif, C2HC5-type-domain-containing protein [Massariosphaeria phaeospora]
MDLATWAVPQLSKLLPLDEDSLKQIVSYTESLSNSNAADHLQNLLGDSPQALEFITSFNNRRKPKASNSSSQAQGSDHTSQVPKPKARKKKPGIGKLPQPRQPDNFGNMGGAYFKKDEEYYMAGGSKSRVTKGNAFALSDKPEAVQKPSTSSGTATPKSRGISPAPPPTKLPPSAAGQLISDNIKTSRNSSPKPKAKVSVQGGTPMHGAATALSDLESAIRALEIQTNPTLSSTQDDSKRKCNCMATRHPLLEAAPNCLNCGKIVCVKEGIGPCTFCNSPLLSSSEIQSMVRVLRDERGKEKIAANNASQKRADVALAPKPFSTPKKTTPASSNPASDSETEKLAKARQHRDRLLAFQANNARRTQVHDESADFETTTAGLSMWASPQERAVQLKRQQKALREQEWNARPEYEKRKVVASIDLAGGRVVKRMAAAERPATPENEDEPSEAAPEAGQSGLSGGRGAFSRNPLLGGLIRPMIKVTAPKGKEKEGERKQTWRRVQDDNDDNEQWILDGGVYGGQTDSLGQDGGS